MRKQNGAQWSLALSLAVCSVSMAATPQRLKEELNKALGLMENERVEAAMTIVRNISGCAVAVDAIPVKPLWVGKEADGLKTALQLLAEGEYALAGGLVRVMSGCKSRSLDYADISEQRKTPIPTASDPPRD